MDYFIIILIATYLLAINVYGVIILKYQKNEIKSIRATKPLIKDVRIFFTGVLGGAPLIYIFMFIFRHKLKNMLFMIIFPILVALYGYLIYLFFKYNYYL
jgi:uncharacterized membrane protein YsdA (DUF1294 family)